MKRALGLVLAVAVMASVASASDLNVSVLAEGGASEITVAPGATVDYMVTGLLGDDINEGLALVGLTLTFDGDDLEPANSPTDNGDFSCTNPMLNFVKDYGITNPDGFGGTVIAGDLVQVGGGQNTILNGQQPCTTDGDCPEGSTCLGTNLCEPVADFPVGTVLTGVAQPGGCGEAVIARGSLTVPGAEGTYTLSIAPGSLFANVIRHMETGEDFYATEAATPVIGGSLVIHADVPTGADFVSSIPAGSAPGEAPASSIWRNTNNVVLLTFSEDITAPGAGEVEVVEMLDGGTYGSDLSASFTFTVENDGGGDPRVLRVQEDGTVLAHRSWYAIRNNGAWSAANNFEIQWPLQVGDSNDDLRVLFNDLGVINGSVPCFSACDARLDINGDGRILFNDLGVANGSIPSFPVNKPEGH